jgi:hypothetical protein
MYGGPLNIEEWRKENASSRMWIVKTPNVCRTFNTYECFLNQETSKLPCKKVVSTDAVESKTSKDSEFKLSKRKTPAHFTKKSLLSLVKQS